MTKKLKFINKEHVGSGGVEEIIMFPIMFMTMAILVYSAIMAYTYVYYHTLANNIANEFNIGNTEYYHQIKFSMPTLKASTINVDGTSGGSKTLSSSDLAMTVKQSIPLTWNYYEKTYNYGCWHLWYVLDKMNQQNINNSKTSTYSGFELFEMPYSEVDKISLDLDGPIFYNNGRGVTIKITIDYKSMIFGASHLPTIHATGYAIIM